VDIIVIIISKDPEFNVCGDDVINGVNDDTSLSVINGSFNNDWDDVVVDVVDIVEYDVIDADVVLVYDLLAGNRVEDVDEDEVDDTVDDCVDDGVDDCVDDGVDDCVDDGVDDCVDDGVDDCVDDGVDDCVCEKDCETD
jgi:hypothetical protein